MAPLPTIPLLDTSRPSSDPVRVWRTSLTPTRYFAATRLTRSALASRPDDAEDDTALSREMRARALEALPRVPLRETLKFSTEPARMRRSSLTPSRSLAATRATVATQTDEGETALSREMRARARATVAALGGAKGSLRCALPRAAAGAGTDIAGQTQTRAREST